MHGSFADGFAYAWAGIALETIQGEKVKFPKTADIPFWAGIWLANAIYVTGGRAG